MKILTWNCAGAFRKKIDNVIQYNSDIYIIQECEHPKKFIENSKLNNFGFLWKGSNNSKGLAIFYNNTLKVEPLILNETYRNRQLKWFLPIRVNDSFDLMAVWTHKAEAEAFQYIGQFYWYLENNFENLDKPIFIGDFNSNSIWDAWDRWWNHTDIVKNLEKNEIISLYHSFYNEIQGKETRNTFFHRKDMKKGYHIDYIFADKIFIENTIKFEQGNISKFIEYSDHIPYIWTFNV